MVQPDAIATAGLNAPQIEFIRVHHQPDHISKQYPKPVITRKSRRHGRCRDGVNDAHLGVSFDGDFDRCFSLTKRGSLLMGNTLLACWQMCSRIKCPSTFTIRDYLEHAICGAAKGEPRCKRQRVTRSSNKSCARWMQFTVQCHPPLFP